MNKEDLKVGETYYFKQSDSNGSWIINITKLEVDYLCGHSLYPEGPYFYSAVASRWGHPNQIDYSTLRKATSDEIAWLNQCIKANKYTEKPINKELFLL